MRWEAIPLTEEDLATYDIIAADLNQDGLPDLVEANSDAVNRYYLNRTEK